MASLSLMTNPKKRVEIDKEYVEILQEGHSDEWCKEKRK